MGLRSQALNAIGKDTIVIADQNAERGCHRDGLGRTAPVAEQISQLPKVASSYARAVSTTVSLEGLSHQLEQLEREALRAIQQAQNPAELEDLRVRLLGKKGQLSAVLGAMGQLKGHERPMVGERANRLKEQVQQQLSARLEHLRSAQLGQRLEQERIDVTMPASFVPPGHRHPLVETCEEIIDLFAGLGYSVSEGPEIETDHYNFTALNIPAHHPARDMQDTFYLGRGVGNDQRLLRTHTSPVQIRYLEANPPPVRVVAPGRVFRRDSMDATHSPVFHQVEVLAIDEGLDFSHLRGTVTTFLQAFFGDLPVRFRASYFPFTEPSAEVDVQWRGRWLEVMGCGMVDPAVLEGLGIDPERWSGFAAGLGVERFCMVRHGIDDIRRLYTSDLRFLEQF